MWSLFKIQMHIRIILKFFEKYKCSGIAYFLQSSRYVSNEQSCLKTTGLWVVPVHQPKHPVLCIEPGLATCFIYDIIHVSMPFSQIIPPSPSPTESKRLFYTSVSLLLSHIQGYCYHHSKFHIYVLVYCIGVFLSGLLHSV